MSLSPFASEVPPFSFPLLQDIQRTARQLAGQVLETPVWRWQTGIVCDVLSPTTEVWLKLELFQKTGSFKLRGALNCVNALDAEARRRGIVAASAGNHAIAAAHAAQLAGVPATVVMPAYASPVRREACRALGAEVVLQPGMPEVFAYMQQIVVDRGLTMVHPFDGPLTALGTGTVGLELLQQVPGLDAVLVPVGGGGLIAGIAAAVKQAHPDCQVFGVEPFGADAMYRSFEAGRPITLDRVETVADSLSAPFVLAYSQGVCRRFVDEIVRVSDDAMCQAMGYLFRDMKLVAEPAAAIATAALLGPLRERLEGRRVGLIVCGSNIDPPRFAELLARGAGVAPPRQRAA
jgi:threonine dehydratase